MKRRFLLLDARIYLRDWGLPSAVVVGLIALGIAGYLYLTGHFETAAPKRAKAVQIKPAVRAEDGRRRIRHKTLGMPFAFFDFNTERFEQRDPSAMETRHCAVCNETLSGKIDRLESETSTSESVFK